MNRQKFMFFVAVYLILIKEGKVLLLRRFNTGWRDGDYTLVAGHVDGSEEIASAMAREAKEEVGLNIDAKDLKVVHVAHHTAERGETIDFYLVPKKWLGEPKNMEPKKCDDFEWFSLNNLPDNTLPNVKAALGNFKKGEFFSEFQFDSGF